MSEVENQPFNLDDALASLSSIVDGYQSEIYIPSKKESILVKEINANQQKELLSAAIDNSIFNTNFISIFYKILEDLIDKEYLETLTIFDKASLAIGIRKQISDNLKIQRTEEPKKKNNEPWIPKKNDISLLIITNGFKSYEHPGETKFGTEKLSITIAVPTMRIERIYETVMHKTEKTVQNINTTGDIQEVIAKEFLGELSKYIQLVQIENSMIDFNTLTFQERIQIVERLPSSLVQEILSKITEWKKDLDNILSVKLIDGEVYTVKIDPLLFVN